MHFFSFFKTLTGKNVTVELKNELVLRGKLYSVDQYLNIKLTNMTVAEPEKHPHLVAVNNIFIRGSVVRYIMLDPQDVEVNLIQDACRRAHHASKASA